MQSACSFANPSVGPRASLAVGGLTPLTTIDYPGRLSAVVYCRGCPWRCTYCHNASLQSPTPATVDTWSPVFEFLTRRRGLLDAVVFSGGEPTSQNALTDALFETAALGFETALHTAGPHPRRLQRVLPLLDWVGMDVKAPFERYDTITGVRGSGERARASIHAILDSGIEYEFRTTVDLAVLTRQDVIQLAAMLAGLGVVDFALQRARDASGQPVTPWLDDETIRRVKAHFANLIIRD
jgi:pyruvate formate lyase activating enzyme